MRFTDDGIESDLSAYNSSDQLTQYSEEWIFDDQSQISWTLYSIQGDQKTEVMDGVLQRQCIIVIDIYFESYFK